MNKTLIIVPAYQEEANILQVLEDIRAHIPQADILVVNDGSTDQTAFLARGVGVKVIDHPFNMGIGAAVQTGFKYAREHDYSEALQIDGDYQHPAQEGPRLLQVLKEKEADLVIGSRFIEPTGYRGSWLRRTGNRLFQWVNALVVGQRIIDNTSGFRAYSRRALDTSVSNLFRGISGTGIDRISQEPRLFHHRSSGPDAEPNRGDLFHHPLAEYLLHGPGFNLNPFL